MDRRLFLLSTLSLAACDGSPPRQTAICDPGLGALLTAEMRARTAAEIGSFDTGNPRWYAWLSGQLLQYGSQRDTQQLMQDLLGRPLSADALLEQVKRCGAQNP